MVAEAAGILDAWGGEVTDCVAKMRPSSQDLFQPDIHAVNRRGTIEGSGVAARFPCRGIASRHLSRHPPPARRDRIAAEDVGPSVKMRAAWHMAERYRSLLTCAKDRALAF
jgi:hypothetical protein